MATRIPILPGGGVPALDFSSLGRLPGEVMQARRQNRLTAERLQDIAEARGDRQRQREGDMAFSDLIQNGQFDLNTPGGLSEFGQAAIGLGGPENVQRGWEFIKRGQDFKDAALDRQLTQARIGEVGAARRERAADRATKLEQARIQGDALETLLVDNGVDPAQAKALRIAGEGDEELAALRTRQTNIAKNRNKPLTDAQAKAKGFADRMLEAEDVFAEPGIEDAMTDAGLIALQTVGENVPFGKLMTNKQLPAEFQKGVQAQRNFINAVLRRESGAVISQEEFDNARQQYFPQPGDKPEVLLQKSQNRRSAISGIQGAAGSPQGQDRTRFKFNMATGQLE